VKTRSRYQVVEDNVTVYSNANSESDVICELHADDVYIQDDIFASGVEVWRSITLTNGLSGYISGYPDSIHIVTIEHTLYQDSVDVLKAPVEGSEIIARYNEGDLIEILGADNNKVPNWWEVYIESGNSGFIPMSTITHEGESEPVTESVTQTKTGISTGSGWTFRIIMTVAALVYALWYNGFFSR